MWYDTYTIRRAEATSDCQEQERTMNQHKQLFERLAAAAFWLAVWQCAAMAVGQEVFLVSPVQALRTLLQLLPQAEFWQRVGFSSGRILLASGRPVSVSPNNVCCIIRRASPLFPVFCRPRRRPVCVHFIISVTEALCPYPPGARR